MPKKLVILLSALLVIVACGIGYALITKDDSGANQSGGNTNTTPPKEGETVTKTGTITCLLHKNTDGPVDTMCAIGLKTDEGTYYALQSDDPTMFATTDQRVSVTGTVSAPETRYESLGTINVTSVEKL